VGSNEVYGKVVASLSDVLGMDEDEIKPDSKLTGDLDASSLDVVDFLFQMKKVFSIELTLAEVRKELAADAGSKGAASQAEAGEQWDDALFDAVTVRDVVGWVESRIPA
jgi:acyl carrier protein